MLGLVLQSPGMAHGRDPIDDHRDQDLGQENGDRITLEIDHHVMIKKEDSVHQVDIAQVQGNDEETDHVTEDVVDQETGHVKEDVVDQETDHMTKDIVDLIVFS